ncbi:MAG: SEL1-like repeat protein [Dysosmobacter sp.]
MNEFYAGKKQQRPPLSKQKEFRAIRNAVIREAENIRLGVMTFEDEKMEERGEWVDDLIVSYQCLRLRARIEDHKLPLDQRDEAVEELKWLAEYGDVHAQYFLGLLYRDDGLLLPDAEQAAHWLELAAKRICRQPNTLSASCTSLTIRRSMTLKMASDGWRERLKTGTPMLPIAWARNT